MADKKIDFAASIRELEDINRWFQDEDIDLDEGLKKLRRGKELIKACRGKLKDVENEFLEIKEEFDADEPAVDQREEVVKSEESDSDDIPF